MRISRRTLIRRFGAGAVSMAAIPAIAEASREVSQSDGFVRLTENTNGYGPSRKTIEAMQEALGRLASCVPREETETFRQQVARHHGVQPDQVVLGCGSGEILRMAAIAYSGLGKSLVVASPTYGPIVEYASRAGANIVEVPLSKDYTHDLETMLAQCSSTTGLVYICNPHNPTGSLTRRTDLEAFLTKVPSTVCVIVDEAYHHYVEQPSPYSSLIDLATGDGRVIVTRTFSKIYGLAGLRIGYAITTPRIASRLDFERLEENLNIVAIKGAAAALDDAGHVEECVRLNANDRQEFCNQANARMLRVIDSHTNFVMVNTGREVGRVIRHFNDHNIPLLPPFPPFNRHLRISLGPPAAMREFWRVWDLMPPVTMTM